MKNSKLTIPEKWILLGIPVLFIISSFLHFAYQLSGENSIVGIISPVNESVWEHIKMVVVPIILWWVLFYIFYKKSSIDAGKWFAGALTSLLSAILTIPLLYYFYTGATAFDNVWVNIALLLVAIIAGQLLGLHAYRYSKGAKPSVVLVIFILIILLFGIYTYYPPQLPIFMDTNNGQYGISMP